MGMKVSVRSVPSEPFQEVARALTQLGFSVKTLSSLRHPREGALDAALLVKAPSGRVIRVAIMAMARVDPNRFDPSQHLPPRSDAAVIMIVADVIPKMGRAILDKAGLSWLDRRGHLRLVVPGVFVDADVDPSGRGRTAAGHRATSSVTIRGVAAISYASALLLWPQRAIAIRELATRIGMSPSTVSDAAAKLRAAGLLSAEGQPRTPDLFWALADAWNPKFVAMAKAPQPGPDGRFYGLNVLGELGTHGWAVTGISAAGALHAWRSSPTGHEAPALDFYVPDVEHLRFARQLLGESSSWEGRSCAVAVAPTPLATMVRIARPGGQLGQWRIAHPVFVALELAQNGDQGLEMLRNWLPLRTVRVWDTDPEFASGAEHRTF